MIVNFKVTDEEFGMMNDALKISTEEFHRILRGEEKGTNAWRIVMARKALGLSNYEGECCHDCKIPNLELSSCSQSAI